jgi:hypothetical protein
MRALALVEDMKESNLDTYSASSNGENSISYPDFKIGNIELAKHLNIVEEHGVLAINKMFAKQLLLKEPAELESGRIPLYVCNCCADLGCGALTVKVKEESGYFIWSDFGYENNYEDGFYQDDYMKRTGPFKFNNDNYVSVIQSYA